MVPQKFYEGLEGLHKTFSGAAKKCQNKNLTWFFLLVRDWDGKGSAACQYKTLILTNIERANLLFSSDHTAALCS